MNRRCFLALSLLAAYQTLVVQSLAIREAKRQDEKRLDALLLNNNTTTSSCVSAPACLEEQPGSCLLTETVVQASRPECSKHVEFCSKKVYRLPTTGLKMTLPVLTASELGHLYATAYGGQATIPSPTHWRPTQQAQFVLSTSSGLAGKTGLTIVEMGCAAGNLLYNLRHLASQGGKLICFEPDPEYKSHVEATLLAAQQETPGLTFQIFPKLFTGAELSASSVDLFLSSHVLEHIADPCAWMQAVDRILKPGGLVFTEVPDQYSDPEQGLTRGQFHLLYFNQASLDGMMARGGFRQLQSVKAQANLVVRALHRKN